MPGLTRAKLSGRRNEPCGRFDFSRPLFSLYNCFNPLMINSIEGLFPAWAFKIEGSRERLMNRGSQRLSLKRSRLVYLRIAVNGDKSVSLTSTRRDLLLAACHAFLTNVEIRVFSRIQSGILAGV